MIENFLRELRAKGIKQKDIEFRTGLTQSYISKLSRGAMPSVETIILLADTFNVSTDAILGRKQKEL